MRTSTPIVSVKRPASGSDGPVVLTTGSGENFSFDAVVFATHSDTTLKMLGADADADERAVLEGIPYSNNDIYLHTGELTVFMVCGVLGQAGVHFGLTVLEYVFAHVAVFAAWLKCFKP